MDGGLKQYRHYRPYTEEEIRNEQGEYFENDATKKALPGLFRDADDVTFRIKDSPLELLDLNELNRLQNSDVGNILEYEKNSERLRISISLMKKYDRDYKGLIKAFLQEKKLPPPIVVRDKNNDLYLMAGNSRLMVSVSLGYNMPVKVIKYSRKIVSEGLKINKNKISEIAKFIIKSHNLNSKIKFGDGKNKGDYEWISDTITIEQNPKSMLDFIESVLHECDHAKMRKKLGPKGYEVAYTRAGALMVDKGKDFYWDNPFEQQARKYEKSAPKWMKKISHFTN